MLTFQIQGETRSLICISFSFFSFRFYFHLSSSQLLISIIFLRYTSCHQLVNMVKTVELYGFCCVQSPEAVTEFVEKHTGKGTVYAVKVFHKDGKTRASAMVQFTHAEFAEMILTLAGDHLRRTVLYGKSNVKATEMKFDMVPDSKTFQPSMEIVKLHFGCQISKERFSVLLTLSDVLVKFGMILKHFYFFFSYDSIEYKLEISYDNVSQIELHRPHGQLAKFLLIQVWFPCSSIY